MINPLVDSLFIVIAIAGLMVVGFRMGGVTGLFTPSFERRPLLNRSELRLYHILRDELPRDWSLMAQVSYGAFLGNRSTKRYMTVNAKRADLVILDPALNVAAVVEYQGRGHYGTSGKSRDRAKKSDRIKRRATSEAGIALLEIPAQFDRAYIRDAVQRVVRPEPSRSVSVAA